MEQVKTIFLKFFRGWFKLYVCRDLTTGELHISSGHLLTENQRNVADEFPGETSPAALAAGNNPCEIHRGHLAASNIPDDSHQQDIAVSKLPEEFIGGQGCRKRIIEIKK